MNELRLLGERLTKAARSEEDDLRTALMFRNGLILCILASAPMRIGAFAKTTIDGHLLLENERVVIAYSWRDSVHLRQCVRRARDEASTSPIIPGSTGRSSA